MLQPIDSMASQLSPPGEAAFRIEAAMGANIAARRREAGMTIAALAAATSLPPDVLRAYEAGTVRVVTADLLNITTALDMRISDIFAN